MSRTRSVRRKQGGQALIEATVGTIIIMLFVVAGILLLINTWLATTYQMRINQIAQVSSQAYLKQMYWLGMRRPDFNADNATDDVKNLTNALLKSQGLGNCEDFKIAEKELTEVGVPGKAVSIDVSFTVRNLRSIGNVGIPLFNLTAQSQNMSYEAPAYAFAEMFIDYDEGMAEPGTASSRKLYFPVLWADRLAQNNAGNPIIGADQSGYLGGETADNQSAFAKMGSQLLPTTKCSFHVKAGGFASTNSQANNTAILRFDADGKSQRYSW